MTPNANVALVIAQVSRVTGEVQARTSKDYTADQRAAAEHTARRLSKSTSHRYVVMTGADFDAKRA